MQVIKGYPDSKWLARYGRNQKIRIAKICIEQGTPECEQCLTNLMFLDFL